MVLVRGAALPWVCGSSASAMVVSSEPSASDGYSTLVRLPYHTHTFICSCDLFRTRRLRRHWFRIVNHTEGMCNSYLLGLNSRLDGYYHQIHYHVLLASTAVVGATSFMLGVDCFTTAGLKEVCYIGLSRN